MTWLVRMHLRDSDGIQDLHLQLSGLAGSVQPDYRDGSRRIRVADGSATKPGLLLPSTFPRHTPGQGDLFINPQVKSDLPPPGGSLPLGGSTGGLIQLSNGTSLKVAIDYQGQLSPENATVRVSNLVSAVDPMPAIRHTGECGRARFRWPSSGKTARASPTKVVSSIWS